MLVFDGNCGFCRYWINLVKEICPGVNFQAYQDIAPSSQSSYEGYRREDFARSIKLFEPENGYSSEAAEAAFRLLAHSDLSKLKALQAKSFAAVIEFLLFAYYKITFFKFISEKIYALVANNRKFFSRLSRKSDYSISLDLIPKLICFTYFLSFSSLITQVIGLFGRTGITVFPFKKTWIYSFLSQIDSLFSTDFAALLLQEHNSSLIAICVSGIILGLIGSFGFAMSFCLAALFLLYMPLVSFGEPFMSFQWDILLLESSFLVLGIEFFKKRGFLIASKVFHFLLKLLLFKLIFLSAMVKIAGGGSWLDLTALNYHYYTQPIPNPVSYFIHQMPQIFDKLCCFLMFVIELVFPFFIFLEGDIKSDKKLAKISAMLRYTAALSFIALMFVVIVTGNYCFFNLLCIFLSLSLLDNNFWRIILSKVQQKKASQSCELSYNQAKPKLLTLLITPVIFWLCLNFVAIDALFIARPFAQLNKSFAKVYGVPSFLKENFNFFYKNRMISSYGLFARMTTSRKEIILQGSYDKKTWKDYEFKFKPGNPRRMPPQVAPHQPRLDWQMWFAALGNYKQNPWLINFAARLLQNQQSAIDLLETNPFPDKAPKYIRAVSKDYKFTTLKSLMRHGKYWREGEPKPYFPELSLK